MSKSKLEELAAFRAVEPASPEWLHLHWQMAQVCSALYAFCGVTKPSEEFLMVKPKPREQTGQEQFNFLKMFAAIHNASVKAAGK